MALRFFCPIFQEANEMNIHIIGGGALGLFFAVEWSGFHQVTLQTRTSEQRDRLQAEGIRVIEDGCESIHFVQTADTAPSETALTVVAVKQYQLDAVLPVLPAHSSVLFIQNGLSHLRKIQEIPHLAVYAASVMHGIARQDGRTIQVNGRNTTKIAGVKGGSPAVCESLCTPQLAFEWQEGAKEMLLEKMAVNAVINPLTALLSVQNGVLADNPHFRSTAMQLCEEFALTFPGRTAEDVFQSVMDVCRKTAQNESSMLSDMKKGHETELDAIVGALIAEAAEKGIQVPAFTLIYHLIKGKTPALMKE